MGATAFAADVPMKYTRKIDKGTIRRTAPSANVWPAGFASAVPASTKRLDKLVLMLRAELSVDVACGQRSTARCTSLSLCVCVCACAPTGPI